MLKEERKKELLNFTKNLGLEIKNLMLLNLSLTHGSYLKGNSNKVNVDNERLEFLGDAVLKLYVSEYIMDKYPNYAEGQLSKLRAYVVSEKALVKVAEDINISKYVLLGKNEKKNLPISILADSVEALIAVIYYDCGVNAAKSFILEHWQKVIDAADKSKEKENFKAVLQEYVQGYKLGLPVYKTLSEVGPDHQKEFEIAIFLNNSELSKGKGKTKKEASQVAAKNALNVLERKKINKTDIKS